MNTRFGKLVEGELTYAPKSLVIDGVHVTNPTDVQYAENGWKEIFTEEPSGQLGVYFIPDGWEERQDGIYRTFKTEPIVAPTPVYKVEEIIYALRSIGKLKAVKAILEDQDLWDLLTMRDVVRSDNEMWKELFPQFKQYLIENEIMTEEEIDWVLKESVVVE